MTANTRTYRIELGPNGATAPSASVKLETSSEFKLLQQVLLQELSELKAAMRPSVETAGTDTSERLGPHDIAQFRDDLRSVSGSIHETRRELAAMQVAVPHDIGIQGLHEELGAVVEDTSRATNTILDAAEAIRGSTEILRQGGIAPQDHLRLDHIESEVSRIFETCNFQDLAGQRINRVVDTLNFIEKRLDRILEIWGGFGTIESLVADQAKAIESERESEGSFGLASGPQIAGRPGHIDQGGIDALFG